MVGEEPQPALTLVTRDSARQESTEGDVAFLASWRLSEKLKKP